MGVICPPFPLPPARSESVRTLAAGGDRAPKGKRSLAATRTSAPGLRRPHAPCTPRRASPAGGLQPGDHHPRREVRPATGAPQLLQGAAGLGVRLLAVLVLAEQPERPPLGRPPPLRRPATRGPVAGVGVAADRDSPKICENACLERDGGARLPCRDAEAQGSSRHLAHSTSRWASPDPPGPWTARTVRPALRGSISDRPTNAISHLRDFYLRSQPMEVWLGPLPPGDALVRRPGDPRP